MKRLSVLLMCISVSAFTVPAIADFRWHTGFEESEEYIADTVRPSPNSNCSDYLYNGHRTPTSACYQYVRNDITPRYGSQYLDLSCNFIGCSNDADWVAPQRAQIVFGRPSGSGWSPCNEMNVNDDTEYWFAFSTWVPTDYYEEYTGHMFSEIVTRNNTLLLTMMFGADKGKKYHGEYHGHVWYDGDYHFPSFGGDWTKDKGIWVDHVIRAVWYNTKNDKTALQVWRNGVQVYSKTGGTNLPNIDGQNPIFVGPALYNTSQYTEKKGGPAPEKRRLAARACDIGDQPTPWRRIAFDEMRITEGAIGKYNYCSVSPPIWAKKPVVNYPSDNASGIPNTVTVTFSGYSDHREDLLSCFAYSKTQVQIDEKGGDWSTPIYDSGEIIAETSHQISNLHSGSYQLRVRHKSLRKNTSETYWGEWSDDVSFAAGSQTAKSYTVIKASSPLTIDGNLEEFENTSSILLTNSRGTIGDYRLLWDDNNLYIGAHVADSEVLSTITARDGKLWNDDSIELFFDVLNDKTSSMNSDDYKFLVNTLNTQSDSNAFKSGWNVAFSSETTVGSGYIIEIAIPWSDWGINVPNEGESFGFDLSMNDRASAGIIQTLWANTDSGTANNPSGWGEIKFSAQIANTKSYTVLKTFSPLIIDGNLEEFENTSSIYLTNSRGTIGNYKLLWDDNNLYIGAHVADSEVLSTITARDGKLWNDDSIELFFDVLNDKASSMNSDDYKFLVNTLNTQGDSNAFKSGWNVAFSSETTVGSGYTIEIAIPWSDWGINVPHEGRSFGFDLSMNDRASAGIIQTLWANTDNGTANNPNGWGEIKFSDGK